MVNKKKTSPYDACLSCIYGRYLYNYMVVDSCTTSKKVHTSIIPLHAVLYFIMYNNIIMYNMVAGNVLQLYQHRIRFNRNSRGALRRAGMNIPSVIKYKLLRL